MFEGLSHTARDAKAWPFEQARNLLARVLRVRLDDAERDLYERNARQLITVWGGTPETTMLFEYAARQWSGLLLQWRQRDGLFAGHEAAISGDNENRRAEGRAQTEQAFRAIGDQQIG